MSRQVSQEFFIETVTSTMELMEISREEAVKDTLQSFKIQGIDPSNLDINSFDKDSISNLLTSIDSFKSKNLNRDQIIDLAKLIKSESDKGLQQRINLGSQGLLPLLLTEIQDNDNFYPEIAECCVSLINGNPDIVKEKELKGTFDKFIGLLSKEASEKYLSILLNFFYNACCKHEENRKVLFSFDIMKIVHQLLNKLLSTFPDKSENNFDENLNEQETLRFAVKSSLCTDCFSVLRVLVKDDDVRAEFGQGCMNAVKFCEGSTFFEDIISVLKAKKMSVQLIIQLLYTLSFTIVREEFCIRVLNVSGLEIITTLFSINFDKITLVNALIDLMNAMSNSDKVREKLNQITIGQGQNILNVLFNLAEDSLNNATLVKSIMSLFSNITLRQIENGKSLIRMGLPKLSSTLFEKYKKTNPGIMRATCLTIRNSINWNRELATLFVPRASIVNPRDVVYAENVSVEEVEDFEIERHLNDLIKTTYCSDEAKSAARDLGLKVDLKNEYMDK